MALADLPGAFGLARAVRAVADGKEMHLMVARKPSGEVLAEFGPGPSPAFLGAETVVAVNLGVLLAPTIAKLRSTGQ